MEDKDYSIDLLMLYFQTFVCRQALYVSPFILAGQVSKDTISSFWLIKKERKKRLSREAVPSDSTETQV